ncbi:hypothetical protein [Streptomyces sp. NPDC057909]|uniref:hypothetical protein n=1 Tax=Streptomyces sp. NPDC057909 TaxID=3346277 RepID=UPI0036E930E6
MKAILNSKKMTGVCFVLAAGLIAAQITVGTIASAESSEGVYIGPVTTIINNVAPTGAETCRIHFHSEIEIRNASMGQASYPLNQARLNFETTTPGCNGTGDLWPDRTKNTDIQCVGVGDAPSGETHMKCFQDIDYTDIHT